MFNCRSNKIKARVSTDKMEEIAKRVKERSVVEDYKKIQEAYDKSQKEIEELKRQLAGATGEKKQQVEANIADDERLLQANEWFEKGYNHDVNKENDKAIDAYTSAIELNQNNVEAYNNRGNAYHDKGQDDRAIKDYNKAIALDPNFYVAYYNRGNTYNSKGQYDRAIKDYNKAIALDPNIAGAYIGRGVAYGKKGQYDKEIEDYDSAIALDPNDADTYFARGGSYLLKITDNIGKPDYTAIYLKYVEMEISDFQKACDLGHDLGCQLLQTLLKNKGSLMAD